MIVTVGNHQLGAAVIILDKEVQDGTSHGPVIRDAAEDPRSVINKKEHIYLLVTYAVAPAKEL